jgi:hypothetical protein
VTGGFGFASGFTAHSAELKNLRPFRSSRAVSEMGRLPKFGRRGRSGEACALGGVGAGGTSAEVGVDIGTYAEIEVGRSLLHIKVSQIIEVR